MKGNDKEVSGGRAEGGMFIEDGREKMRKSKTRRKEGGEWGGEWSNR